MTNTQIIDAFVNGADVGKSNSMTIDNDRLFSYDTPIAYRLANGRFAVNVFRWSVTTSGHINKTMRAIRDTGLHIVEAAQTTLIDRYGQEQTVLQNVYGPLSDR